MTADEPYGGRDPAECQGIIARFDGKCHICGGAIKAAESLIVRCELGAGRQTSVHEDCGARWAEIQAEHDQ